MPSLLIFFLESKIDLQEAKKKLISLFRFPCIFGRKCTSECQLCYKSWLISGLIHWELYKFKDGNWGIIFRSPQTMVFPQAYTLIRLTYYLFKGAIKNVVVPVSVEKCIKISLKNNTVVARNIKTLKMHFFVDSKTFPPPHLLVIKIKKRSDIKNHDTLKNIIKKSEKTEIEIVNNKIIKYKILSSSPLIRHRFDKFSRSGLFLGNPRVYSNKIEFLELIYKNCKEK